MPISCDRSGVPTSGPAGYGRVPSVLKYLRVPMSRNSAWPVSEIFWLSLTSWTLPCRRLRHLRRSQFADLQPSPLSVYTPSITQRQFCTSASSKMAPQEFTEIPPDSKVVEGQGKFSGSQPVPSSSTPSNSQILDILLSIQKNQQKIEQRLDRLEQAKGSPRFEGPQTKDREEQPVDENAEFIGAIDQGTTSSRFLIFNREGIPVASHQIEFKQIYPNSGWHEHDPLELVSSVTGCIEEAVKKFTTMGYNAKQIKAIGITNQRETTVVWNAKTGEPLYNAIVWTDTRSAAIVRELKARSGADQLKAKCGLPLSTYPSCSKLLWMLENVPKVHGAYNEGNLAFGTVDTWLSYKLNGSASKNIFVSDPTNASRTMFMNLETLDYDDSLIDFFKLDRKKLHMPKIVRSSDPEAYGSLSSGVLAGTPITGCLGDQSAALVGQKGFEPG